MNKGHQWSGWPGCFCLKCGAEDAYENALAMGWISFVGDPEHPIIEWKSPRHKEYVDLLSNTCYADLTPTELENYQEQLTQLKGLMQDFEDDLEIACSM